MTLRTEDRSTLEGLTRKGTTAMRVLRRAQALLHADAGWLDREVAEALHVGTPLVAQVR